MKQRIKLRFLGSFDLIVLINSVVRSWKHQKGRCFSIKIVFQNVCLMLNGNYLDRLTRILFVFAQTPNSPEMFDVSSSLSDYLLLE